MLSSVMEIPEIRVFVSLGCEDWERDEPQEARVSLKVGFINKLKAEETDEITDAVCYSKITSRVFKMAVKKEYKLIEALAHDIYLDLLKFLPENILLQVKVHKVNPPVKSLKSGVYYTVGALNL